MKVLQLSEDTFELFAARYYDNPECFTRKEFDDDLNRFKYLKRIFRKYKKSGKMDDKSIRLALNHIILILNVWGVPAGSSLLFFKIEPPLHSMLRTFLIYLQSCPKTVNGINTLDIQVDQYLVDKLRKV